MDVCEWKGSLNTFKRCWVGSLLKTVIKLVWSGRRKSLIFYKTPELGGHYTVSSSRSTGLGLRRPGF